MTLAALVVPLPAAAHRSGCHRWHSCPSDSGSYVCGDLGYDDYCGGEADESAPTPTADPTPAPQPQPEPQTAKRTAGSNRFATAVAVSGAGFPSGAPVVYVATAGAFPDALAAGPAAAEAGGPVLLVNSGSLPEETRSELVRLAPDSIVVAGGAASVSEQVVQELRAIAPVVRQSGTDRFATAVQLSRARFATGVAKAYVAAGADFRDALAAAAAAAVRGVPLLLTGADALPAVVQEELVRLAPGEIVVVGDNRAVSDAVMADLRRLAPARRLSGADAAGTAVSVCQDLGAGALLAYAATSANFPDALAAGAAAGKRPGCLLYVTKDTVPSATAAELARLEPSEVVVLGGAGVISDDVLWELDRSAS